MINLLDGKHNERLWKATRERRLKAGKKQMPNVSELDRKEVDKMLEELEIHIRQKKTES